MNLNPRERNIAIAVAIVIGLFLLDYIFVEPLLAARDDSLTSIKAAQDDLQKAHDLINLRPALERRLAKNIESGLTHDQSSAESQLLNNIQQWAQETQLALPALKPAGTAQPVLKPGGKANDKEKAFLKVSVRVTGDGNLMQIARFLYKIQTATIPVRVTDISVQSKKDGMNDLEVNLNVSSIFLTADAGQVIAGQTPATHATSAPASQPRGRT